MSSPIVLTQDQQNALEKIKDFLIDPVATCFVLKGYSGCGKSTLVRTFLDQLPDLNRTLKLIDPDYKPLEVKLTATTNKAVENLYDMAGGYEVSTIYSLLGLRVETDYKTGETRLVPRNQHLVEDCLIFIDEASWLDHHTLPLVFSRTHNCKIVFVGDPAQLLGVKAKTAPVFEAGFPQAELTQVVRQAEGNPIVELGAQFRHTVLTGEWPKFVPDGKIIRHVDRGTFLREAEAEFSRSDWKHRDSKILAWTNKCVIGYNQYMRNHVKGNPHFQKGDYAICNSFTANGKTVIKTDQTVLIEDITNQTAVHDVAGKWFTILGQQFFMPNSLQEKADRLNKAKKNNEYQVVRQIESEWIDLRAAFSSTVDKSQGSTYRKAFIDLDDLARCNDDNRLARMLYVGATRASHELLLTGDLA